MSREMEIVPHRTSPAGQLEAVGEQHLYRFYRCQIRELQRGGRSDSRNSIDVGCPNCSRPRRSVTAGRFRTPTVRSEWCAPWRIKKFQRVKKGPRSSRGPKEDG